MRIICLLLLLFHLVFSDEVLPDEHDLLLKLFDSQSYDSSVRPVYNSSKNVVVTFGFTLIQIMDMVCNILQKKAPSHKTLGFYCFAYVHPSVAQSVMCLATDASLTADPGVASSIQARSHTFVEFDHKIISTAILLPSAE